MIESFKWLVIATFGVWALVISAFLIYFGWVYLELKKTNTNRLRRPPQFEHDTSEDQPF